MGARVVAAWRLGLALLAIVVAETNSQAELVARYSFNESDGASTLEDSAGSADGELVSLSFAPSGAGVAGSTGFGNAGVFDGSSVVLFGTGEHPASFDLGIDNFTIAGWFKTPTNFLNEDRIIFQNQSFSGGGWSFEVGRADRTRRGKVFFTVGGGPSATFALTQPYSDLRLDDDAWHWIAVSHNAGTLSMYVDGALQIDNGTMQTTSTATSPVATEAAFGARAGITPFQGQIDEWSIYNHALSSTLSGSVLTGGELFDLWQQGAAETSEPGDFDGDGDVDSADLALWQGGYGTGTSIGQGDADGDGDVDGRDFVIWQRQYTGPGGVTGVSAVPEPCGIALMCAAIGATLLARRVH